MQITIIISDTPNGATVTATHDPGAGSSPKQASPPPHQANAPSDAASARASTAQLASASGEPHTTQGTGAPYSGGPSSHGISQHDTGSVRSWSPEPPPDVLRAAAASGAFNAGAAPMLLEGMHTSGAPQPFVAAGVDSAAMAARGVPDQSAGAAPGADRMAPSVTISD